MPTHDTTRLIAFADTLADAARNAILPYFRAKHSITNKLDDGRFDPVTEADQAAERAMLALIERAFPITAFSAKNTASAPARAVTNGSSIQSTAPAPSSLACQPGAC